MRILLLVAALLCFIIAIFAGVGTFHTPWEAWIAGGWTALTLFWILGTEYVVGRYPRV